MKETASCCSSGAEGATRSEHLNELDQGLGLFTNVDPLSNVCWLETDRAVYKQKTIFALPDLFLSQVRNTRIVYKLPDDSCYLSILK